MLDQLPRRSWLPALALALVASPVVAGEDSLPPGTVKALKAATVFLKVESGGEAGSGSGFVIKTDGQTAYLVTNNHVIAFHQGRPQARPAAPVITAIFDSGGKDERAARAEILAADVRRDLAVLRVRGVRNLPTPIDCNHDPDLVETMSVITLGFPLGELLSTGKRNPAITVTRASVSSIRLNDRGDVATVQIAGDITPGNSGGPVVDTQGRLVGIATGTVRNRPIGFAVPATALTKLLQGRLLDYHFTTRPTGAGELEVQVELSVFDPFNRIKGISFYYLEDDARGAKKLASINGVHKIDLQRTQRQVIGAFKLAGSGNKPVAFQTVYVNGSGKTLLSHPRVQRFRIP